MYRRAMIIAVAFSCVGTQGCPSNGRGNTKPSDLPHIDLHSGLRPALQPTCQSEDPEWPNVGRPHLIRIPTAAPQPRFSVSGKSNFTVRDGRGKYGGVDRTSF